jgi:DNA-binding transcriptional ArsR family regulator
MISRSQVAVNWALEVRGITPTAWKILMILAHMVNNTRGDWDAWPHQKTFAEMCDMSVSTLRRHLDELEEGKFIIRQKWKREDGGVGGCVYTLNVNATFTMPNGVVEYRFATEEPEPGAFHPLRQNTHGVRQRRTGACVTADVAKEPLNIEPSNVKIPPSSKEEGSPAGEHDLFGKPEEPGTAMALIEDSETLAEFVTRKWGQITEGSPGVAKIRKIDDGLAHTIELRGKQHARDGETPFDVWDEFLTNVATSRFLRGLVPPGPGRETPFKLTIAWAANATHFRDIIGGKYNADRDPTLYDNRTGRKLGPSGQALGRSIAKFRDVRERGNSRR